VSTPAVVPLPPFRSLPANIRAGDALAFQVQTQLPAGALVFFVLSGIVRNAPVRFFLGTKDPTTGVLTDANGIATFTLPSATTAAWQPGRYDWVLFSLVGENREQLAQGSARIDPDLADGAPIDPRTRSERMLASVQALLEGKTLDDVAIYKLAGRELTKMTLAELQAWEATLVERIRRERLRRNGRPVRMRSVDVTFGGCQ
jgi:hypothetical protein